MVGELHWASFAISSSDSDPSTIMSRISACCEAARFGAICGTVHLINKTRHHCSAAHAVPVDGRSPSEVGRTISHIPHCANNKNTTYFTTYLIL